MTEYPYNLIPKDKLDVSTIDRLFELSDAEMDLIVYDLLKWIQDMNWPVAGKIVDVLSNRHIILEPHIIKILSAKQNDNIWKYWIIASLISNLKDKPSYEIVSAIKRIAEHPTKNELAEEVDIVAKKVLFELKS